MSYQHALCSRVVRAGQPAMEAVLKYGIEPDDFTADDAKSLWGLILAYFTQAQTAGSVVSQSMLGAWFKGLELQSDEPSLTIDALCYQVRRERLRVASNLSLVRVSEEINNPLCNPVEALAAHHKDIGDIISLGYAANTKRLDVASLFEPLPADMSVVEELGVGPGAPVVFAGYGSSQKSFAAQGMLLALAAQSSTFIWGKFARARRCRVLHLDYEQGKRETQRRYQKLARGMGLVEADLQGFLEVEVMPPAKFAVENQVFFEEAAKTRDVVLIDSFAGARDATVDENSAEARAPLDMLTAISEKTGCTFIVIHHSGKGKKDDVREVARGSSAIYDAMSSMLAFVRDVGKNELSVMQAKNRGAREVAPFTLQVVDDDRGGTTIVADSAPTAQTERAVLAARVVEHLERHGGTWPGSVKTLKAELRVSDRKHSVLQDALTSLVQIGRLRMSPGQGRAHQTVYVLEPVPVTGNSPAKPAAPPRPACSGEHSPDCAVMSESSPSLFRGAELVPEQAGEVVPFRPPLGGGTTSAPTPAQGDEEQGSSPGSVESVPLATPGDGSVADVNSGMREASLQRGDEDTGGDDLEDELGNYPAGEDGPLAGALASADAARYEPTDEDLFQLRAEEMVHSSVLSRLARHVMH